MFLQQYVQPSSHSVLQKTKELSEVQWNLKIFMENSKEFFIHVGQIKGCYDPWVLPNVDRSILETLVSRSLLTEMNDFRFKHFERASNGIYKYVIQIVSKIIEVSPAENITLGVSYFVGYIHDKKTVYVVPVFRVYRNEFDEEPMFVDVNGSVYTNIYKCLSLTKLPSSLICLPRNGLFSYDYSCNKLNLQFYTKTSIVHVDHISHFLCTSAIGLVSALFLGPFAALAVGGFAVGYHGSLILLNSDKIYRQKIYCCNVIMKILEKTRPDFMSNVAEIFHALDKLVMNVFEILNDELVNLLVKFLSCFDKFSPILGISNISSTVSISIIICKRLQHMYNKFLKERKETMLKLPSEKMMDIIELSEDDYTLKNFLEVTGIVEGLLNEEGKKYLEDVSMDENTEDLFLILCNKNGKNLYISSAPLTEMVSIVRKYFNIPDSVPFVQKNENLGKFYAGSLGTFIIFRNKVVTYVYSIMNVSAATF